MRDLRAELRLQQEDDPIEWMPKEGDIVVGFVRSAPVVNSDQQSVGVFLVCEERALTPVNIPLDSPQMTALLELHNPQQDERVGIKYVGIDNSGVKRYQMVVDRAIAPESEAADDTLPDSSTVDPELEGDSTAATPEEKSFIEELMSAEADTQQHSAPADPLGEGHLRGLIDRQEAEFAGQTRTLERLGAVIRPPASECRTPVEDPSIAPEADPAEPQTPPIHSIRRTGCPKPVKQGWLSRALPWLAIIAALSAGAGYVFYARLLPWWP